MALKSSEKSLENQEPEIIFKIGPNYFYSETYRDMFLQISKHYTLNYAYDTFIAKVKKLKPVESTEDFVQYDFKVPNIKRRTPQTDTIPLLPKSALLR